MAKSNTRQSGTGEFEIQFAILELMRDQKIWSNADLKYRLKNAFAWSPDDLQVGKRPNEYKWENRINNALGRARSSSLYAKGYVESCGHGLHKISDAGLKFINSDDDFEIDDVMDEISALRSAKQPRLA